MLSPPALAGPRAICLSCASLIAEGGQHMEPYGFIGKVIGQLPLARMSMLSAHAGP